LEISLLKEVVKQILSPVIIKKFKSTTLKSQKINLTSNLFLNYTSVFLNLQCKAHLQYGYTFKDIAEYIGVHYTTVSRAIKKIEREDEK
jgi:DNA-binding MarR family transcriptional regulator